MKPDYKIEVEYGKNDGEWPVMVKVTSVRYKDSQEFSGKSVRSLLLQAAKWIDER